MRKLSVPLKGRTNSSRCRQRPSGLCQSAVACRTAGARSLKKSIVQKLFERQFRPSYMNRATTFIGEVFRGLQVQGSINVHDESSEKHKSFSSYLKQRSKVNEIAIAGDVLLILEERGLCIAYDVARCKRICYLNVRSNEVIRSLFYNKSNNSVLSVFVCGGAFNQLQCRSIPLQLLHRGKPEEGEMLFESEVFTYPGFIEFDDVNSKVLTFSAKQSRYRMWDLKNYSYLYSIDGSDVREIKVSPGIVLVIKKTMKNHLPLQLLNVETGEVLKSISPMIHRGVPVDIIEQFNEFLLIKQKDRCLKIIDVKNCTEKTVDRTIGLQASSFMFLFEKRLFLTVEGKSLSVWNFQGETVARFEDHELWNGASSATNIVVSESQEFVISYCTHRNEDGVVEGSINVSDSQTGARLAKVTKSQLQYDNEEDQRIYSHALEDITALSYNEKSSELFTGTRDGTVYVWKCFQKSDCA